MTKQIIVVFLALSAAVLLIWYGTKVVEAPTDLPAYTFTSAGNESIEVRFDNKNDTAILTGAGYEDLVFTRAISASVPVSAPGTLA